MRVKIKNEELALKALSEVANSAHWLFSELMSVDRPGNSEELGEIASAVFRQLNKDYETLKTALLDNA